MAGGHTDKYKTIEKRNDPQAEIEIGQVADGQ
jgi:hypothetical protein